MTTTPASHQPDPTESTEPTQSTEPSEMTACAIVDAWFAHAIAQRHRELAAAEAAPDLLTDPDEGAADTDTMLRQFRQHLAEIELAAQAWQQRRHLAEHHRSLITFDARAAIARARLTNPAGMPQARRRAAALHAWLSTHPAPRASVTG